MQTTQWIFKLKNISVKDTVAVNSLQDTPLCCKHIYTAILATLWVSSRSPFLCLYCCCKCHSVSRKACKNTRSLLIGLTHCVWHCVTYGSSTKIKTNVKDQRFELIHDIEVARTAQLKHSWDTSSRTPGESDKSMR